MNLLSLFIYVSCATAPAVLAADAAKPGPDPKTTVVFTCTGKDVPPTGWCVSQAPGKLGEGYNFDLANVVGPPKDMNYNCIGKKFTDNSACCKPTFKPAPNGLTKLGSDCIIKPSNK
ncbi:hypothetical protein MJO28_014775 [Puccinia striiformis f. sp. tritici]|uniref:Secreted protein n=3 Tax=Puccinia striiformis TaxID=27350 RepID=A0A0L0VTA9_9BASI|nr:hypothetical protein Pst134EA_033151 [Puccinia striiformis f. sp. tritici]KAI9625880.1 hypothetical protein H4Q26_016128 [Puccinia striiformis f. sp. tritici PST-130]KNF02260.1 hypothetical protein PSTG_04470 [Puccinia striiformis f. sp. tritici PST-78]POW08041.1 hypothetical protein PSTT_07791 [Puccinia striiformis]KAH9443317.1 hypothetical protein Pst134EB_033162 [Puccinia striiformis f. sp. tritici]KAH9450428.1 hypothetical protein Pst134EA_033151 [Puccinia striiformis f. sp. tritici]